MCSSGAWARVGLYVTAGGGWSYISMQKRGMSYRPFFTPHVSALLSIPVVNKLHFEPGVILTQKGAFNYAKENIGNNRVYTFKGHLRFHYVNLPLMLSYNVYKKGNSSVWLGGGMNYGLMVWGTETARVVLKENGKEISDAKQTTRVRGAFTGARYLETPNGKFVNALDVMARAQVRYVWKDKWVATLFHDHSLYDINAQRLSDANSVFKMRYTGLSLGMKF